MPAKISWPNLNHKLFISQESNIEKLGGVATLPLSFPPSGTKAFYFINRPPTPNILGGSVSYFEMPKKLAFF